jgi:hypothetical protein
VANLSEHVRFVHDQQKDYKCDHCAYACVKPADLRKHIMAVHKFGGGSSSSSSKGAVKTEAAAAVAVVAGDDILVAVHHHQQQQQHLSQQQQHQQLMQHHHQVKEWVGLCFKNSLRKYLTGNFFKKWCFYRVGILSRFKTWFNK